MATPSVDTGRAIAAASVTIADYCRRIGIAERPRHDLAWLAAAQRAHLRSVPFENFDVFAGIPVGVDTAYCLDQVVGRRRGGWCFVLNGAFGALLESVGFAVRRLGAAVLLGGPSTVIDHECLEVETPEGVFLVDVGFGDRGPTVPLAINSRQPVDDGIAQFAFFDSSQGLTLTRTNGDEMMALYRFRRVTLSQGDFDGPSQQLQKDKSSPFHAAMFASLLTESPAGPAWVTLTDGQRKIVDRTGVFKSMIQGPDWTDFAKTSRHSGGSAPEHGQYFP